MPRLWAGVDAGKTHHHCVVIDADGVRLLVDLLEHERLVALLLGTLVVPVDFDHVAVGDGAVRLTDSSTVRATHSDGTDAVVDATTLGHDLSRGTSTPPMPAT